MQWSRRHIQILDGEFHFKKYMFDYDTHILGSIIQEILSVLQSG